MLNWRNSLKVTFFLCITINALNSSCEPITRENSAIYKQLDEAAATLKSCLANSPSQNPDLGCVDSLKQLHDYCTNNRLSFFYFKRKYTDVYIDAKYCKAVDASFPHLGSLFQLDEKACVKGYETVAAQLQSFHRNSTVTYIEDPFNYDFEKSRCKEIKKYVNFCAYVDGDVKNRPIDNNLKLPSLTQFMSRKSVCPPTNETTVDYGISNIESVLFKLLDNRKSDVYNTAATEIRKQGKRSIASDTNNYCEQTRLSFLNLGCQKWDLVSDEDPIYIEADKIRDRRLNQKDSKGGGSK